MAPIPASLSNTTKNSNLSAKLNSKALPGPKQSKSSKQTKLILTLFLATFIVILIGIVSSILRGNIDKFRPVNDNRLKPTSTPIPTAPMPSPVYGQPSEYSNDPQILQLEGTIKNFLNEMNQDDLSEPEIQPPILEKNINFK